MIEFRIDSTDSHGIQYPVFARSRDAVADRLKQGGIHLDANGRGTASNKEISLVRQRVGRLSQGLLTVTLL